MSVNSLRPTGAAFPPATRESLKVFEAIHEEILRCEPVAIATEHLLHGGMYARTVRLKPGTVMEGSLIKLATLLIVNGSTFVWTGKSRIELSGYNVIPGSAGRKLLFATVGEVEMTMVFPTQAMTVEAAENEVFAEADLLLSRADGSRDTVTITGE